MFDICLHFILIYFCYIFWSSQVEVQMKAHAKLALFWVFKDNWFWNIYRSCIILMQDFLVSLAKILVILAFVAKNSKNFLGFLSTIMKSLANSCETCQDWLPRSWQEISKIQGFSWQDIQDFSWFSCQDLGYSWFSCQEVQKFLPGSPKIFLDFFPRSWKILQNLANLAKNNCQDLGKEWMSKFQEIFWQEKQDAKHWDRPSLYTNFKKLLVESFSVLFVFQLFLSIGNK